MFYVSTKEDLGMSDLLVKLEALAMGMPSDTKHVNKEKMGAKFACFPSNLIRATSMSLSALQPKDCVCLSELHLSET